MAITKINSLGVNLTSPLTFSAGTASLPSITFSGDTNTGVFSPTADTVAFTEGGAEAMRIDSGGRLVVKSTQTGVGTFNVGATGAASYPSYSNPPSGGFDGGFFAATLNTADTFQTMLDIGAVSANTDATNGGSILRFLTQPTSSPFALVERMRIAKTGAVTIVGSLSKGSGSFKIDHPLPEKKDTHHLVHSFTESPQADLLYRGKISLVNGTATINIDTVARMTEGTFVLLNREVQCFTTNETGWTAVKGSISGNTLTITAQDNTCNDTISWLVIGERQDQHMYDTEWTDENGKVIVEPLKETILTSLESK